MSRIHVERFLLTVAAIGTPVLLVVTVEPREKPAPAPVSTPAPPAPVAVPATSTTIDVGLLAPVPVETPIEPVEVAVHLPKPETSYRCPDAMRLGLEAGFEPKDLAMLDRIVWRESRCLPAAVGYNYRRDSSPASCPKDWERRRLCPAVSSTDLGLTQINDRSWRRYLIDRGIIADLADLLDPLTNLRAARALYVYSRDRHGTPWSQWGF